MLLNEKNEMLLGMFEDSLRRSFRRYSENTIKNNMNFVTRFLAEHEDFDSFEITSSQIIDYLCNLKTVKGREMNVDSKQQHQSAITKYYNFLFSTDNPEIRKMRRYQIGNVIEIRENPVTNLEPINGSADAKSKRSPEKTGLPVEDIKKLLDYCKQNIINASNGNIVIAKRDYAIFVLMFDEGLRISDVILLKKENFDFKNKLLTFVMKKTKKEQTVQLSDLVIEAVQDYWVERNDDSDIAFSSKTGNLMSVQNIDLKLKKYSEKLNIKHTSCHTLRHSCGAMLYEQTKDLEQVRKFLGHSSITTTQRYIRSDEKIIKFNSGNLQKMLEI